MIALPASAYWHVKPSAERNPKMSSLFREAYANGRNPAQPSLVKRRGSLYVRCTNKGTGVRRKGRSFRMVMDQKGGFNKWRCGLWRVYTLVGSFSHLTPPVTLSGQSSLIR